MRRLKKILLIICILPAVMGLICFSALAEDESDIYSEQYKSSGLEEISDTLPDESGKVLNELMDLKNPETLKNLTAARIMTSLITMLRGKTKAPLASVAGIIAVIIISALVQAIGGNINRESLKEVFGVVAVLTVATAVILPIVKVVITATSAVAVCGSFMLAFIPVYAGILIAMGKPASAAGMNTVVFAATQIIVSLCKTVVAPIIGMQLALSVASSVTPAINIKGLTETIKRAATVLMVLMLTVFTGMLSIQTAIGAAADNMANRTARFVVGSFVPVVGANISEGMLMLQSSLSMLKASSGIYAVIAMTVILLPAAVEIILWQCVVRAAYTVSDVFSMPVISALLHAVAGTLSLILAVVLMCALIFIISVTVVSAAAGSL